VTILPRIATERPPAAPGLTGNANQRVPAGYDRGNVTEAVVASYRPGATSRVVAWIDALPLRGVWVYPALAFALFAWGHAVLWASGRLPVGTFDLTIAEGVVYGPYGLAAFALVNRVALQSLDAFWPATGKPDSERPLWPGALRWAW
jgi:hypothetical protein